MKKLPLHLQFYLDPELQKGRTTNKKRIFNYLVEGTISPSEAESLNELVHKAEWIRGKRYLSETKAGHLGLCTHQYHARMTEIRQELLTVEAPYLIVSVRNPNADEVLHFMVDNSEYLGPQSD